MATTLELLGFDDGRSRPSTPPPPRLPTRRPRSRLPRTSPDRLARATPDVCPDGLTRATQTWSTTSLDSKRTPSDDNDDTAAATVLYLAYGSNMAAATFEGRRGVRPLSCVSVSAPALDLTFDLPGIPYTEPCFANTAVRKRVPKIPDRPPKIPPVPVPVPSPVPSPPADVVEATPDTVHDTAHGDPVWTGGLYGVVYEVTRDDYARIVASEGGGASYQDLLVPCLEVPPSMGIPEEPPLPEPPRPFLAHTLWAPQVPGGDDNDGDNDDGGDDDDDDDDGWLARRWKALRQWLLRLAVARARPDPAYAQPSPRYLQLLVDGAAEHDLPPAYQAWLASLAAYRITTCRQRAGQVLLLLVSLPAYLLFGGLLMRGRLPGGSDGRLPLWAVVLMGLFTRGLWWLYDTVLHPLFGDGERTEEPADDGRAALARWVRRCHGGTDEEKVPLRNGLIE